MKKHVLAIVSVVVALVLMIYVYSIDSKVHSFERASHVVEKSNMALEIESKRKIKPKVQKVEKEKENDEVREKLKSLTQKAGNISSFKVSKLYKGKCASCHGINGGGGVGSKIIGLSYEQMKTSLRDFKSGAKKNYVMYGLLQNLSDEQLDNLAREISLFEVKLKEAK